MPGAAALLLVGDLLCAPFAGRWMLERLASQYPERPVAACPAADAIAVYPAGRPPLLVLAADGVDTADEARLIVAEARNRAWRRLVLVTSGFHMGRALRRFRQAAQREGIRLSVADLRALPAGIQKPGAQHQRVGILDARAPRTVRAGGVLVENRASYRDGSVQPIWQV